MSQTHSESLFSPFLPPFDGTTEAGDDIRRITPLTSDQHLTGAQEQLQGHPSLPPTAQEPGGRKVTTLSPRLTSEFKHGWDCTAVEGTAGFKAGSRNWLFSWVENREWVKSHSLHPGTLPGFQIVYPERSAGKRVSRGNAKRSMIGRGRERELMEDPRMVWV